PACTAGRKSRRRPAPRLPERRRRFFVVGPSPPISARSPAFLLPCAFPPALARRGGSSHLALLAGTRRDRAAHRLHQISSESAPVVLPKVATPSPVSALFLLAGPAEGSGKSRPRPAELGASRSRASRPPDASPRSIASPKSREPEDPPRSRPPPSASSASPRS